MSQILTPGERPTQWGTAGDHDRRIRALEAVDPCECFGGTSYQDIIDQITYDYAYYKLPEEGTDDWVDSSGGGRNLTDTTRTGEVRGVEGVVEEDDGKLGVYVGTDTPGSANPASYIGSRTGDSFFRFAGTAAFSVIAWIKPDFTTIGGVFSWGICGNVNNAAAGSAATAGWGLYVEPTTDRVFFRRRSLGGTETESKTVTQLVEDTWHMAAGTYDGTTIKVWLNGAVEDSDASANSLDTSAGDCFFLGNCGIAEGVGGTWAPWKGTVDSVIVAAGDLSDLIPDLYSFGPNPGVQDGYVWTSVGGVAMWAPPTIEVEF